MKLQATSCLSNDVHRKVYGHSVEHVIRAPGRINLIGEHVDYLDGRVLPMAINKELTMGVSGNARGRCRIWSEFARGEPVEVDLTTLAPHDGEESWLNYIIGVLVILREEETFSELPSFDATITSDIPAGAGLSSSAALETATSLAVEALLGVRLDSVHRARICQKAEHEYANVPCGIMDQLAVGCSVAGHALLLDCSDLSIRPVPIPEGIAFVVADTQVKHALGDGEYRMRLEDCEAALQILKKHTFREVTSVNLDIHREALGDRLFRRARHVVTEMARVDSFVDALAEADTDQIGKLLRSSHDSLRDDFEVSCPELDHLVESAYAFGLKCGLIGARMTGGGFGGSTINLVHKDDAEALVKELSQSFLERFGRAIEPFVSQAADCASLVR